MQRNGFARGADIEVSKVCDVPRKYLKTNSIQNGIEEFGTKANVN
jgi:hypothetical protein